MQFCKILIKRTNVLRIICIVAVSVMISGCHSVMDSVVRNKLGPGFNSEAPQLSSIAAYQTNDPETKVFLKYIGALENDPQGIRGKVKDAKKFEAEMKKAEVELRKAFADSPVGSREENYANAEKAIEDLRRDGPSNELTLLPIGAEPEYSGVKISKKAAMGNEDLEVQLTSITASYKFSSAKKMSEKAFEISNKLRPVFAAQQGWKFQDSDTLKKQMTDIRSSINNNATMNPEAKQKTIKFYDKQIKIIDAGQANAQYFWPSGYRSSIGSTSIPANNLIMISIMPITDPEKGNYILSVGFTKSINQPRNKL